MAVLGQCGCIRAKVVVFGQSGCIWAKWLYSGKVVLFGQMCLYSGKISCIWAKVVGQSGCKSGCISVNVPLFGRGCIRVKRLYSGKSDFIWAKVVFVFRENVCILGKSGSIRDKVIRAKVVVFGQKWFY